MQHRLLGYLGLALGLSMLLACGGTSSGGGRPANVPDPSLVASLEPLDIDELEQRIHDLVNRSREQNGLGPLDWNQELRPIALAHSENMAARNEFAHVVQGMGPNERYVEGGYTCRVPAGGNRTLTGGENLYLGNRISQWSTDGAGNQRATQVNNLSALAAQAVQGWMLSPEHRDNMLNPHWRTETIAVHVDAYGRVWVTQNFC